MREILQVELTGFADKLLWEKRGNIHSRGCVYR